MKVKELYKKYKGYDILLFGKPLKEPSIPFYFIPHDRKEQMDCYVKEMKIIEGERKQAVFGLDMKFKRYDIYKGTIQAYIGREK